MTQIIKDGGRRRDTTMSDEVLSRIEEYLWPKGYSRDAWMMVDAARDRRIFGLLLECFYSDHSCLFAGPIASDLQVVAPYLVQLSYDDKKTRKFISMAWNNSWGVFVKCDARLEVLRRHLRSFLLVRDESGNNLMFRYYDPRILRIYLPTCRVGELETVFGPIERFLMEDETADTLLDFSVDRKQLVTTRCELIRFPSD
jgi:Domain of unknown function (DUF4123)